MRIRREKGHPHALDSHYRCGRVVIRRYAGKAIEVRLVSEEFSWQHRRPGASNPELRSD
jgi:hypothetical protein